MLSAIGLIFLIYFGAAVLAVPQVTQYIQYGPPSTISVPGITYTNGPSNQQVSIVQNIPQSAPQTIAQTLQNPYALAQLRSQPNIPVQTLVSNIPQSLPIITQNVPQSLPIFRQNLPQNIIQSYPQMQAVPKVQNVPVNLPNYYQQLPLQLPQQKPCAPKVSSSSTLPQNPSLFDSNVINNLAIALQLLILTNLLSVPLPEKLPQIFSEPLNVPKMQPIMHQSALLNPSVPLPYQYTQEGYPVSKTVIQSPSAMNPFAISYESVPSPPQAMLPNSQFLSSSYSSSSIPFGTLPQGALGISYNPIAETKASYGLKSPYEALLSSSSYSDPYELQSPYASISAYESNNDLFPFSDYY